MFWGPWTTKIDQQASTIWRIGVDLKIGQFNNNLQWNLQLKSYRKRVNYPMETFQFKVSLSGKFKQK